MFHRAILFLVLSATPAAAHFGHLGEVAGHAHWVALGAVVAAAGFAAAVARGRRPEKDAEAEQDEVEDGEEPAA